MKMDCVSVASDVIYQDKECYNRLKSDYSLDMWEEMKKRWLMFGVLFSIMLAVLAPRVGASGGPLHTEYVSYVPLWLIYYAAGCRSRLSRAELRSHVRLCALSAAHAHVAAPALCVVTVAAFEDIIDHRIIKGALLSSVGAPCGWLSLSLCQRAGAAPAVAANYVASLVAAPLGMLLLCGRAMVPALGGVVAAAVGAGAPFCAGLARPRAVPQAAPQLAALLLLYAECCTRLARAEGALYVGDVLGTMLLELCYVWWSCALCWVYWRCGAATTQDRTSLALCALPKALQHGWESSVSCSVSGLSQLPAVLRAPAHALLLAALVGHEGATGDHHTREKDSGDYHIREKGTGDCHTKEKGTGDCHTREMMAGDHHTRK